MAAGQRSARGVGSQPKHCPGALGKRPHCAARSGGLLGARTPKRRKKRVRGEVAGTCMAAGQRNGAAHQGMHAGSRRCWEFGPPWARQRARPKGCCRGACLAARTPAEGCNKATPCCPGRAYRRTHARWPAGPQAVEDALIAAVFPSANGSQLTLCAPPALALGLTRRQARRRTLLPWALFLFLASATAPRRGN